MKRGFLERAELALEWREARKDEWPTEGALSDDLDWIRQTGTGFVSEINSEKLFLFERDWSGWPDPPGWGLASQSRSDLKWQVWGSFEPLPETWKVPESVDAQNR
jgi:hypothetical protein